MKSGEVWSVSGAALLAVLIWGGSFPVAKYALGMIGPLTLLVVRDTLGAAVIWAGSAATEGLPRIRGRDLVPFAMLSLILTVLHQGVQIVGMLFTTATDTSWLIASSPIFVALLARVLVAERLIGMQWAGLGLGLFGVLIILTGADLGGSRLTGAGLGDLLIVASAVAWGGYSAMGKRLLSRYPPRTVSAYGLGLGMLLLVPIWLWQGGLRELSGLESKGWLALFYLAVPATAVAHWLWSLAIQRLPAGVVGVYMFLPPLVATLISRAWLAEPLPWSTAFGGLFILAGVGLVMWRNAPKPR